MAPRTTKITSEIVQTCKKYLSTNTDLPFKRRFPLDVHTDNPPNKGSKTFRYKITNTEKPKSLPTLNLVSEDTALFTHLQPCYNPEFNEDRGVTRWVETPLDNIPFPSSIKPIRKSALGSNVYGDRQKAEDKFYKCKMSYYNPVRSYSISTPRHYSRNPADNSGEASCKNIHKSKIKKCVSVTKKKKECRMSSKCPRFNLSECKQSKGSNCKLLYLDPHCVKKFAPYPSYSEACAEANPEDPSECQQCPWRTCDGADTIEPGKPVRNKRHYSTLSDRHLDSMAGIVGPSIPPLDKIQEYICDKRRCGVSKTPCKEPIGPCAARRQKEERAREEQARQGRGGSQANSSPKKKAAEAMVLRGLEGNQDANPYSLDPMRVTMKMPGMPDNTSWLDIPNEPDMSLDKDKRKHPNCHRRKKPKRPKGQQIDVKLIAKPSMELSDKKGGQKRIKGDEGDPPPCTVNRDNSKKCPKEPLKKPKYRKRPMTTSFYKNPEEPYNKNQ